MASTTASHEAGGNRPAKVSAEPAQTPPLPTYLVALVAGRLDAHPPVTVRGVPVRTPAAPLKER